MTNTPDVDFFNPVKDLAHDLEWQKAAEQSIKYIEWRASVLNPIERYLAQFYTPWVPYFPVVLRCAPKRIKFRFKKRKKRIIKKWFHRYNREKLIYLRSLRIRCRYPNRKKIKKVMTTVMCESYNKSHVH